MTRCHQQTAPPSSSHYNQHNYKFLVHVALITVNTIFGLGSIIGKLGLHEGTNPLSFTFLREVVSGSILLFLSYYFGISNRNNNDNNENNDVIQDDEEENVEDDDKAALEPMLATSQRRSDVTRRTATTATRTPTMILPQSMLHLKSFVILGMLLFINQSFYIVGIQLGGPVTGSVWQPSAPIFTAVISMIWKLETWNIQRIVGVFVAFVGCSIMILLGSSSGGVVGGGACGTDVPETISFLIGNLLFCCQCLAASFYILLSKNLLSVYPSLAVTAWSYLLASPFMCISAFLSTKSKWSQELICPTCSYTSMYDDASESATPMSSSSLHKSFAFIWIPKQTIPALAYYILAQSVAAWGLLLWSNQYATGTLVMGYSVLQPVTSLFFTVLILFVIHLVPQCGMDSGTISSDAIAQIYDDDSFYSDGYSIQTVHADGEEGQYQQCLNPPGLGTFCGIIGVVCGLSLIITTEPSKPKITTVCVDDDGTKTLDGASRNQYRTNGDNYANNDDLLRSSNGYSEYGTVDRHPPNE